ncbi:hypothetical protein ACFZAM_31775 [Streptomyces sp. NPDC008079]|uniref:hypothetical protein n=1 Tax=Streptomyces sp. NPDC008079 TaxID=3364806 RepID=UPI0036E7442C
MTAPVPDLAEVLALTPAALTPLTPRQIDAFNAVLDSEYGRIDRRKTAAWDALYGALHLRKIPRGRTLEWPVPRDKAEEQARAVLTSEEAPDRRGAISTALERLDTLREQTRFLDEGARTILDREWTVRGGWPRFFLVQDGHIHIGRQCHTLRMTTQLFWRPELSGLTEEDAVKQEGPFLCTFCYPSAPTDWKLDPADARRKPECSGSRTNAEPLMTPTQKQRGHGYVTCPECGKTDVRITSTWRLRSHPPMKESRLP